MKNRDSSTSKKSLASAVQLVGSCPAAVLPADQGAFIHAGSRHGGTDLADADRSQCHDFFGFLPIEMERKISLDDRDRNGRLCGRDHHDDHWKKMNLTELSVRLAVTRPRSSHSWMSVAG